MCFTTANHHLGALRQLHARRQDHDAVLNHSGITQALDILSAVHARKHGITGHPTRNTFVELSHPIGADPNAIWPAVCFIIGGQVAKFLPT